MDNVRLNRFMIPLLGMAFLQPGLVQAAQTSPSKSDNGQSHSVEPMGEPITASILLGKEVKDKDGKDVGDVQELVVNRTGRITHAIISFGGFMGMGDEMIPVPWAAFELKRDLVVTPRDSALTLAVTKKTLEDAPRLRTPQFPLTAEGVTALDRANAYFNDKLKQNHETKMRLQIDSSQSPHKKFRL